eukprot:gnl/Chilomastix_caulleri/1291.p2 GENE.gnl/Chilomastix_caulleri/1291~~gnl/Chilomastix_caulleri/1291.p2  ORF type:complete len:149 (+),score=33.51 gnl/Chilomastix_caulleri/1291:136-582(+)
MELEQQLWQAEFNVRERINKIMIPYSVNNSPPHPLTPMAGVIGYSCPDEVALETLADTHNISPAELRCIPSDLLGVVLCRQKVLRGVVSEAREARLTLVDGGVMVNTTNTALVAERLDKLESASWVNPWRIDPKTGDFLVAPTIQLTE